MCLSDHRGMYVNCCQCAYEGCTADDISWDEVAVGWVCDQCREDGIPEDVKHLAAADAPALIQ